MPCSALLALLAVAGVFLILGLLSGYLRLSERVAEAEIVKSVADGLDDRAPDRRPPRADVLYRNRALQRLTGTRAGRHATLEELFAGEPQSAQAFFRLNRAAERGEAREEEFHMRSRRAGDGARTAGCGLRVRPFPRALGGQDGRLTLWQVADVTRERAREIETVSGLESTLAFYDNLPQGLFAVAPDGRIAHVNATLSQWLRPAAGVGPRADADRHRTGRRRRTDPRRRPHAPGRATRLELDLLREDGRALPSPARLPRPRSDAASSPCSCSTAAKSSTARQARAHTEMRLTRVFQSAPFGIATADAAGRIVAANAAFMRMFAVEGRGVPATVAGLVPDGEEEAARELAKALRARDLRAAPGQRPSRCSSAPNASWPGASM